MKSKFFIIVVCVWLLLSLTAEATLVVGFATRDGIVLAADSRLSRITPSGTHQMVSDAQIKLLMVQSRILVGLTGKSDLGKKSVWKIVEELGEKNSTKDTPEILAQKIADELSTIHKREIQNSDNDNIIIILLAGYQEGMGKLFEIKVPEAKVSLLKTTATPGMAWIGDVAIPTRLVLGVDTKILEDKRWNEAERKALKQREFLFPDGIPLADAVEAVQLLIQTAMDWSRFFKGTIEQPDEFNVTIGGPIDVAAVTSNEAFWIQKKNTCLAPVE